MPHNKHMQSNPSKAGADDARRYLSNMKRCPAFVLLISVLASCSDERPEYEDFVQRITQAELLDSFGPPTRKAYFYEMDTGDYIWSPELQEIANINRSSEVWFYPAQRTITVTEDRKYVLKGWIRLGFEIDNNNLTPALGKGWIDEEDVDAWFSEIEI